MSLQDDYFDVLAELSGNPAKKQFENIWKVFCDMESQLDANCDALKPWIVTYTDDGIDKPLYWPVSAKDEEQAHDVLSTVVSIASGTKSN
ncbi:MAG: hypothetical protein QM504_10245 [Pseudomonadota bacterium]